MGLCGTGHSCPVARAQPGWLCGKWQNGGVECCRQKPAGLRSADGQWCRPHTSSKGWCMRNLRNLRDLRDAKRKTKSRHLV